MINLKVIPKTRKRNGFLKHGTERKFPKIRSDFKKRSLKYGKSNGTFRKKYYRKKKNSSANAF